MPDFVHDPGWLDGYRRGDRDALERLYRAYVRPLDRQLRLLARWHRSPELGQASAVADFLQEVFARAFAPRARQTYDGIRDFGTYLSAIARNVFIDALRMRGRETLRASDEGISPMNEGGFPLEDALDPRVRTVLGDYVAGLAPELKDVYLLRFADGKSQDDACALLRLSRRKLRTRENHLRKGLRRALVKAGISLAELSVPTKDFAPTLAAMVGNRVQS